MRQTGMGKACVKGKVCGKEREKREVKARHMIVVFEIWCGVCGEVVEELGVSTGERKHCCLA